MDIDPGKDYAVITGDVIGFSGLPTDVRRRFYVVMKACGNALASAFPGILAGEVEVFRGDGWQALVHDPALGFRAALFIRAYVCAHLTKPPSENHSGDGCGGPARHIDTRLAIGIGPVDYVPGNRVSAGDGPAFRRSGKLLDRMAEQGEETMGLAMAGAGDAEMDGLLDGIVRLAGALAARWSPEQALAVIGAIQGGKTPERAAAHPQPARWRTIARGLAVFETALKDRHH